MKLPFSATTRVLVALASAAAIGLLLAWMAPEAGMRVAAVARAVTRHSPSSPPSAVASRCSGH